MLLLSSLPALACGGFFCNNNVPVQQTGESIAFGVGDGEITAHVRIDYEGDADAFSWVVPVPSEPELFASTEQLFQVLDSQTGIAFQSTFDDHPSCAGGGGGGSNPWWADTGASSSGTGGVTIVQTGKVGPYDSTVLQATDGSALETWLNDNAYDVPVGYADAVDPYVQGGMYFVAIRLQKNLSTGAIVPLGMRYAATRPMIPIVLTRVAATEDMPIRVHIFGDARAVPDNYLHLKINDAVIDWTGSASNYEAVVAAAVDEAGGHAWATESAGPTAPHRDRLWFPGRYNTPYLSQISGANAFMNELQAQGLPIDDLMLELLRIYMPMPEELDALGVQDTTFYSCVSCFWGLYSDYDFDNIGLAIAIQLAFVEPAKEAERLFQHHPVVTRMITTLSPDEMTVDPSFVFNADMGAVDRTHTATVSRQCQLVASDNPLDAPIHITLDDGREIEHPADNEGMDPITDIGQPAASLIEQTSASGDPVEIWSLSDDPGDDDDDDDDDDEIVIDDTDTDVPEAEPDGRAGNGKACSCTATDRVVAHPLLRWLSRR